MLIYTPRHQCVIRPLNFLSVKQMIKYKADSKARSFFKSLSKKVKTVHTIVYVYEESTSSCKTSGSTYSDHESSIVLCLLIFVFGKYVFIHLYIFMYSSIFVSNPSPHESTLIFSVYHEAIVWLLTVYNICGYRMAYGVSVQPRGSHTLSEGKAPQP